MYFVRVDRIEVSVQYGLSRDVLFDPSFALEKVGWEIYIVPLMGTKMFNHRCTLGGPFERPSFVIGIAT
jgi:hypothetical protein